MEYIVKGTFVDTPVLGEIRTRIGELKIKDGKIIGFRNHFDNTNNLKIYDYSDKLILPGLIDLHLHAPQYSQCGLAMDVELITWLSKYTYPLESKFEDVSYAKEQYEVFVKDLLNSATTRFSIFSTLHTDATIELMDQIEKVGLVAYVGKLNMNRNCPDYYSEHTTKNGVYETNRWIDIVESKNYKNVYPILTPRFTPSVTDDYMEEIGKIAKNRKLAMQSHLSENKDEIEWVKELCPNTKYYAETYSNYGLFGKDVKTIMAHCIYSNDEEKKLMKENGVYIAHCPTSNENVIAGICPSANYLRHGYHIGLGSDVSGGQTLDLFEVMKASIQVSKIYWKYINQEEKPLTIADALYMATIGGGRFFGDVGLFEENYEFDAIVLDESKLVNKRNYEVLERIERFTYLGNGKILSKFVRGNKVL